MKHKLQISEAQLKDIIKESVKNILNESMVFPQRVDKIYFDGDEFFLIKGNDGMWYDCYPKHGDCYLVPNIATETIEMFCKKIISSCKRVNLQRIDAFPYSYGNSPQMIIEMPYEREFAVTFKNKLYQWLERHGFKLIREDLEMYNMSIWELQNADNSYNLDKINKKLTNMTDVTKDVIQFFGGFDSPKVSSLNALEYLLDKHKRYANVRYID